MKKVLILLFISLSLTAQSSSGPDWFDAPLEACIEAAEKGVFIDESSDKARIKTPEYIYEEEFSVRVRNFIYDGKEFSLLRVLPRYDGHYCLDINELGCAFCEYAKFNADSSVKPVNTSISLE